MHCFIVIWSVLLSKHAHPEYCQTIVITSHLYSRFDRKNAELVLFQVFDKKYKQIISGYRI